MAAPLTCDDFLDVIRDSGVVEETKLQPFLERMSQAPGPRELADEMLEAGLITSFQKDLLLQGKRRGYIIADKYILLNQLGSGGMGSVYLCEHKVMRRRVAIKVLPTAFSQNPEYVDRFHREARAAAALDHPNIVRAFDVDRDEKIHFLVMEYVEGCSLQELVARDGPLDVRKAAYFICQSAVGLQHAHEAHLVHRDIKPSNLLVDKKGTVKILDMGLAMFFQEQGQSLTQQYDANAVLGTAEYLAPEQAMDSHGVDIRADIYSLGLTFYFLLTAKSPYGDEGSVAQKLLWHQMRTPKSVREYRPEVPEEIDAVITKMLAKNREERYQTPAEVVKALTPFVKGKTQTKTKSAGESETMVGQETGSTAVMEGAKTTISSAPPAPDSETEKKESPPPEVKMDGPRSEVKGAKPKSEIRKKSKPGKEEAEEDEEEERSKDRKKGPRSGKKGKSAGSFWTTRNLVLIGSGAGVFVLLLVGVIFWAMSGTDPKKPVQVTQGTNPDGKKGQETPGKGGPETKKETPTTTPGTKKEETPKGGKTDPAKEKKNPPTQEKKSDPSTEKKNPQNQEKKTDPAKEKKTDPAKEKKNPQNQEKKNPQPQKKESLNDFFPKPGKSLTYDIVSFTAGSKGMVMRQKWDFMDKGIIQSNLTQIGEMEGSSLLKGGKVKWRGIQKGQEQARYQLSNSHFEMMIPPNTALWEPILPRSAAEKDSWEWTLPNGTVKKYTVQKFENYRGKRAVVVQATMPAPGGGNLITRYTYAQGIGEVAKSQTLEKPGNPPQLLAEAKLVD